MSVVNARLHATRERDVLAGLEEIRWEELEHAYGPAADVPDLLRALRSPSKEREHAIH